MHTSGKVGNVGHISGVKSGGGRSALLGASDGPGVGLGALREQLVREDELHDLRLACALRVGLRAALVARRSY